jgi:hypothetical protein
MPPAAMVMDTPVKSVDDNKRYDYGADIKYLATDEMMIKLRAYRSEYKKRRSTKNSALMSIIQDTKQRLSIPYIKITSLWEEANTGKNRETPVLSILILRAQSLLTKQSVTNLSICRMNGKFLRL